MGCIYNYDHLTHKCQMWDEDSPVNPEGADENGYCVAEDDEDPSWCHTYESDHEPDEDEEVCDYCGEPLGFCALDCESLEEDFED